jgi:hypothetical protein
MWELVMLGETSSGTFYIQGICTFIMIIVIISDGGAEKVTTWRRWGPHFPAFSSSKSLF